MNNIMYCEITPHSETLDRWNDVTINAGASQSTLQDIKLPEVAGCFTYRSSGDLSSCCSNRFIYWRTNHDVIELVEISLDFTLRGNHLRLRFQNTPILRGVSIHENHDQVVLLVATVSAIHKLVFPHPRRLERDCGFPVKKKELAGPSVFFDTTGATLRSRSCYFVLNHVSLGIPLPHTSCSWLDAEGNATFVLANSAGSVLMVVMSDRHGVEITTTELMKSGSIFRLFNGLVPAVMRNNRTEVALSIVCHQDMNDVLVFSLFSDLQIRIWSHKRQECLLVDSVLNFDSEKNLIAGNFTAHQCHLRKSLSGSNHNNFYLGIYVPVPHQKMFYIFQPLTSPDKCKLKLVSTLRQTQHDLVDFCISNTHIWTLWLSFENQPIVFSADIESALKTEPDIYWVPVDLEPQVCRTIDYGASTPQEAYLKEIFKVGRFLPSTISKAISIYQTVKNSSFISNVSMKVDDLRSRVIEAVESEILMKTGNLDGTENDYCEIAVECWDRFFSYCIQYHEVGMKPLGMSVDPCTGCVILIKKNFYSLLCPCDSLELMTSPNFRSFFFISLLDEEGKLLYHNLRAVLSCIDLIHKNLDDRLLIRFEEKLCNLYSPITYANEICKSLDLQTNSDFLNELQNLLPSNVDLMSSLNYLLTRLDLGTEANDAADVSYTKYPSFANSSSGIGALCAGLSHFAKQRFEFCRDMLLLEVIVWGLDTMENEQLENLMMQSTIIPRTVSLVRSYYVILWCTERECVAVLSSVQDAAFKQFCVLELPEFTSSDLSYIKPGSTISHLFFQEDGGCKARKIMEMRYLSLDSEDDWSSLFPSLIISAATLLWPLEGNLLFPEFLFARCQYLPLQEYDRQLQGWCIWNKQFLNFLVASSYLILGQPQKALRKFLEVSKHIEAESYLCNKLIKGRYSTGSSIISLFCMRVIQMFEQFSLSVCVVELASTAIDQIKETDPHVPIFYSVLFKHHLNLGHSTEAFSTLIKNPDSSRRKDCLRQLIVKLCEEKQFQKIIEFNYLAYEEEVIAILESRARCSDLCHNTSFYGILYALHIHHKKYRKAAASMYELAMRFGREVTSFKGLRKQVSCYLAAINCLHLAEPEYAWIVKPSLHASENLEDFDVIYKNSPKRNSEGDEILSSLRPVKVEVLGLPDILREYNLAKARLLYVQKYHRTSNLVIAPLTPEETVALLLNGCLFEPAIQLSNCFSLSLIPVFEAIAYRCLNSCLRSDVQSFDDVDRYSKQSEFSVDLTNNNPMFNVWHILEKYLLQYEKNGKSELHRCVTEKLLAHGSALPAWLKLSYQKRNFTELLNLYITHGLFEDSLNLVINYIKAVLGTCKDDFNLKFALLSNSPPVWLPHTYIDILLYAATDFKDGHFQDLYEDLTKTLDKYNKTVESVTSSKLSNCSV